jgi:hypothetical protein
MPRKVFTAGAVLTAADVNTYLQDQAVMSFATTAARGSAIGTATEGMTTYLSDSNTYEFWNGTAWQGIPAKYLTAPIETTTVSATAATGTINYDVNTQADLFYTTNATGNFTLNFRASATVTLNTLLATGQTITLVFRNTNGATAYRATAFQIDGSAVTPKWQGGAAPSAGNASSVDVYTFAITKTGSAAYQVFGSFARFA